jgi:ABC-type methionine transport system ATPase subunit
VARALLKDGCVFLLDEATSALDGGTEKEILDRVDELTAGKTVLVITHRITNIVNTDWIVYLCEGRVAEQDSFFSIVELSEQCRYNNCTHANEPGCAIQAAIADQSITQTHFDNYRKLLKEKKSQKRRAEGAHAVKRYYRNYFKKIHSGNKDQWQA